MLDRICRDLDEWWKMGHAMLKNCSLDARYTLPFLYWLKTWRAAVRCELYRISGITVEYYFVGWYHREICLVAPEVYSKLYVQLSGCINKYKPCRALLVTTSLLFAFASRIRIGDSLGWKALYCATLTDHCNMAVMVFLRRVQPEVDVIKLDVPGFNPRMRELVSKEAFISLLDMVFRFVLVIGVDSIVAKTSYWSVRAHTAVLRFSEFEWSQQDCPSWYGHDYRSARVREVLPKHRGGQNYFGAEPRNEGVKEVNFFDVSIFDEKEGMKQALFKEALNAMTDKKFEGLVGEEDSSVVVRGKEKVRSTAVVLGEDGKGHTIDIRSQHSDGNVRAAIREGHKAPAGCRFDSSVRLLIHRQTLLAIKKVLSVMFPRLRGMPRIRLVLHVLTTCEATVVGSYQTKKS